MQGIRSDRVPDETQTEVCDTVQETRTKTIPMEKKYKKGKMVFNGCEMKRSEKQRRKGKILLFECNVPKNSQER